MAQVALEQLREAVILGELVPGAPLRLDDLARSLGMSISPIREAVRELEALGLAESIPHQGAKVVALDVEDLRELFEVRLALETVAVRRAAAAFAPEDERAARAHLADAVAARAARNVRAALRAHTDFHFALYRAAGSRWLLRLIRPAWDSCDRFRPALLAPDGELQERHRELDERLVGDCVAHDADAAAQTLYEHLELAEQFYAIELGDRGIFEH